MKVKAKIWTIVILGILFLIFIIQNALVFSTLKFLWWKGTPRTIVVILISFIIGIIIGVLIPKGKRVKVKPGKKTEEKEAK
ncbi:DUF1049 domain-containing protein [candidate division WOR-3 bacterium]|nr:DUF1049 domain-containing protein [candidate division WOR-3 bacterium]